MRLLSQLALSFGLFGATAAQAQNIPAYVPASGLAAWYPFSGNALDSSGNGNAALIYGPVTTADRFGNAGKAYRFNGTSSYMKITTTPASTLNFRNSSFSISLWFKSDWQTAAQDMQLFFRGDQQNGADPYLMYLSSGSAVLRRDVNTGSTYNTLTYSLSGNDTGIFHHLAGTYDSASGTMRLYLDGVLANQVVKPGTISYNTDAFPCFIGSIDNGQFFKGVLDDIGIWTRVLDACEITKLYHASPTLITQQPAASTVVSGGTAAFSIQDVGSTAVATYQWQVNTGGGFANVTNTPPYTGATTKTLTIGPATAPLTNYQYRCVRTGGGCITLSNAAILHVTTNPTSVASGTGTVDFALYPNPNNGLFLLQNSGLPAGTECDVTVMDLTGRTVQHLRCRLSSGEARFDLGSNLVPGVYALKLTYSGGQKTLPFLKTN